MTANLFASAATFRECAAEKASFVLLSELDLVLTVLAMSLGFSELNPLMRELLNSPVQLLLVKCLLPFLIAWVTPGKLLLPAILALGFVVGWDTKELVLSLL